MNGQFRLVLLLWLIVGLVSASTPQPPKNLKHDIVSENLIDSPEEASQEDVSGKSGTKISTPKVKLTESTSDSSRSSSSEKKSSTSTTPTISGVKPTAHKPISPEILNDLIEASKHNLALADDPRFNKMLSPKIKSENATNINSNTNNNNNKVDASENKKESTEHYDDEDNYDDYNYDDDDYNYNDASTTESNKTIKPKSVSTTTAKPLNQKLVMKPIKNANKQKAEKKENTEYNNIDDYNSDDEDDSDEDDDDLADENDLADDEQIIFSENVPCPRYCVCARNVNAYLVATCSRLDTGTQKFGSDITDLIVTDVGPKYPILLGPEFFAQLGLKQVSSIKIANSTIEYLHPAAFHGLDELYSVNLTNVGLSIISPDTFSKNKKLRMLTISGNDLSVMSSVQYLLNSSSIEELDLSRNNLIELNPKAFTKLTNIVYINLSQNNLQQIPEHVFDTNEKSIEELDLSYNSLKSLPPNVFNRTSIAILHLKYNSFTGNLSFGTPDLQQLDLSFNSINQVHHGMFDKMSGLTNLNLKGNGITKIQSDSFINLKSLRHIDLSINEFDQLSSMIFYKNTDLDVIRLSDNPKLSQLPTDGFLNVNGYFTAYYLDISNCAVGALGHKTFSTMPHLATLKLAWNNINNLERDTFNSLSKLIDLDLSNNLISKLDDMIFMNNNELTKLNLAGNPIRKLSVRLFMPMSKLRELDVSDCELSSLLSENNYGIGKKYKFFETLRSFNASANQIKRISSQDVKHFKNLRTLDISNNPLRCNEDFQDFIGYVSLNSHMSPRKISVLANLENDVAFEELQQHASWSELAHEVCKHHEADKNDENNLENRIENTNKELDKDAKKLLDMMENSKLNKILKDHQEIIGDHLSESLDEDVDEEEDNNGGEDIDDDEDSSDYDEDEDDDEDDGDDDEDDKYNQDTLDKKKSTMLERPHIKDIGIKVDEIILSKDTKDEFLLNKFIIESEEKSDDDEPEEELIIERGHIYFGYNSAFMIQAIAAITCLLILFLAILKLVLIVRRKRGEQYRMSLIAASKNSFVYQKLTEDIKPKEKELKQPKIHRYAPINQV